MGTGGTSKRSNRFVDYQNRSRARRLPKFTAFGSNPNRRIAPPPERFVGWALAGAGSGLAYAGSCTARGVRVGTPVAVELALDLAQRLYAGLDRIAELHYRGWAWLLGFGWSLASALANHYSQPVEAAKLMAFLAVSSPVLMDSGEYRLFVSPKAIAEQRGTTIVWRKQHPQVTQLFRFLASETHEQQPLAMAVNLCTLTSQPVALAAIGYEETGFVAGRKGSSGELGKWQLMDHWRPAHYRQLDDIQNMQLADRALKAKIRLAKGSLAGGIMFYNGKGPRAEAYQKRVLATMARIRSYRG